MSGVDDFVQGVQVEPLVGFNHEHGVQGYQSVPCTFVVQVESSFDDNYYYLLSSKERADLQSLL